MRPERRSVPGLAGELPALQAALAEDPSPRNVMKVAEGLWLLGQPEEALALLDSLSGPDASLIAPNVLAAWCLEDVGRPDEAAARRRGVAEIDPANPFAADTPAPAPEPSPVPVAEEAVTPPGEVEAEPERPLTEEELREVPPDPLYSATLAEIFARQGFPEKAIEIYRRLGEEDPEDEDVRSRLRALEDEAGGIVR